MILFFDPHVTMYDITEMSHCFRDVNHPNFFLFFFLFLIKNTLLLPLFAMSQRQPFAHYNNGGNKRKYTSQNLDRLLSRAPPQANFNINYEAYTILIPNYSFGKPTLLPGSGGLMAIAIGKRYVSRGGVYVCVGEDKKVGSMQVTTTTTLSSLLSC